MPEFYFLISHEVGLLLKNKRIDKPETISTHLFSCRSVISDAIETGLLLLKDFFHPSSFFNSTHIASLSESGVFRATKLKNVDHILFLHKLQKVTCNSRKVIVCGSCEKCDGLPEYVELQF